MITHRLKRPETWLAAGAMALGVLVGSGAFAGLPPWTLGAAGAFLAALQYLAGESTARTALMADPPKPEAKT